MNQINKGDLIDPKAANHYQLGRVMKGLEALQSILSKSGADKDH